MVRVFFILIHVPIKSKNVPSVVYNILRHVIHNINLRFYV